MAPRVIACLWECIVSYSTFEISMISISVHLECMHNDVRHRSRTIMQGKEVLSNPSYTNNPVRRILLMALHA
jgi:hypothetical protein